MEIRCAVACHGKDGPVVHWVLVLCNREQYDNADHYDAAQDHAVEGWDYNGPFVVFDENDGPAWLFANYAGGENMVNITDEELGR